jgi:hypothetical protein
MNQLDETCYVFAARYAHNRGTGAAFAVVSALKRVWWELSPGTQKQILRESHDATQCESDWEDLRTFAASKCKWTHDDAHCQWVTECGHTYDTSDLGCETIWFCPHCRKPTTVD